MNELVKAIKLLKPTSQFSFTDNDYSTIKWDVLDGNAPTQKEIDDAIIQVKNNEKAENDAIDLKRQALLKRLGITEDEARLLLA